MTKSNLPLAACYHPTTVCLIDDNKKYTYNLKSILNKKVKGLFKVFIDPLEALNYLTKDYKPNLFLDQSMLFPEEDNMDHRSIDIDVRSIRETLYNPRRFETISVLVVDQVMPGLMGEDLCRKLRRFNFKILMLTGEGTNVDAVRLFNESVIDRFVNKSAKNFSNVLATNIKELQYQYFRDLSKVIFDSLIYNKEHHPYPPYDDPVFIKFFLNHLEKNSYTEFYMTDSEGTYMFIDASGKPSWLVLKNEECMHAAHQLAAELSDHVPTPKILNELKDRKKVLYLHNRKEFFIQPGEWDEKGFLHPATLLEGEKQKYYYAYVKDPNLYDIQKDKITSFKKYLKTAE